MLTAIIFSVEITLIQITGAYLRYLPFSRDITEKQLQTLRLRLGVWSVCSVCIYFSLSADFKIDASVFRPIIFFGWLPYFLLSLTVIRNRLCGHLFVLGMQGLWAVMLHAAAVAITVMPGEADAETVICQRMAVYLLLFVILWSPEKKIFSRLPAVDRLPVKTSWQWMLAVMPMLIMWGTLWPIVHTTYLPHWSDRLSRLSMPIMFFLIFRLFDTYRQHLSAKWEQTYANRNREMQLKTLQKQAETMEELHKRTGILRHDMRHSYRLIYIMLENGDIDEAMHYVEEQEDFT